MKIALSIAGSDSGAGAGIQADLKSFAANGVYGLTAITAITAQNTMGVSSVYELPVSIISSQIDTLFADFTIDAVKTGMLPNSDIINLVADKISFYNMKNVVVDPVMVAKGGSSLLRSEALSTIVEALIPKADIITPNIDEAESVLQQKILSIDDMIAAARQLKSLGAKNVLLKGGHLPHEDAVDILYDGQEIYQFQAKRIQTKNTHGTGCSLASSIAANLAKGYGITEAVKLAKDYIHQAISHASTLNIGKGHGPLYHFYKK